MGKRCQDFEHIGKDFYPTPLEAVKPLLRHLKPGSRFAEPCAGDGRLVDHLIAAGHVCVQKSDIDPQRADIEVADARCWDADQSTEVVVTNPPWTRPLLHELIVRFSDQRPTWLLFDADWKHTKQAVPFMPRLVTIVSVGRVKWIAGSKHTGKDNAAWYLFDPTENTRTVFHGRERPQTDGQGRSIKAGSGKRKTLPEQRLSHANGDPNRTKKEGDFL